MAISNIQGFTNFPSLPAEAPFVKEDGNIHPLWMMYLDQLTKALQQNFKPEGMVVPQQTSTNIGLLTGTASIGNIIYNSTVPSFQANLNGTWKTITLT
jgi:hypothetical protein